MESKYNILIVDDELSNLQLGINILKQQSNYNIIFATSGEQALERLKEHDFDLILLDIIMEPMDGFEVCREIKSNKKLKDIPIIFLTAKNDEESIQKGFNLGAVDYITKPFFATELLSRVKTHLELKLYRDDLLAEIKLKDRLMFQQNKMATMGEMMENIVHQWKQPLSVISTISTGFKAQHDYGLEIPIESLVKSMDKIMLQTDYLSDTINDFRDFFKEKEKVVFNISDIINKTLDLLSTKISNKEYIIEKNIEDIQCKGFESELVQVLMNLLNNAADALENVDKKFIKIDLYKKDNSLTVIKITDNAGGIPEDQICSIFKPYFTTKIDTGTGIGLYMSEKIIEKHFNGILKVENVDITVDNEIYKGAEFTIEIPTSIN